MKSSSLVILFEFSSFPVKVSLVYRRVKKLLPHHTYLDLMSSRAFKGRLWEKRTNFKNALTKTVFKKLKKKENICVDI